MELEELRRQCAELEKQLCEDPLTGENQALKYQLVQMQDDYQALKGDYGSMRDYFGQRLSEMTQQLEEQSRAAGTSEGHADCLHDLLHFHEDQGQLAGSYWRAQCEKRDDSIRFLTLKLQEYTVPSSVYQAQRQQGGDPGGTPAEVPLSDQASTTAPEAGSQSKSPSQDTATSTSQVPPPGGGAAAVPAATSGQAYQALLDQHLELCKEIQAQEEESLALEKDLEAAELKCAALKAAKDFVGPGNQAALGTNGAGVGGRFSLFGGILGFSSPAADTESQEQAETGVAEDAVLAELNALEAERCRLCSEVEACEQALAASSERERLPVWAHRCIWRDELDV